MLDYNFKYLKYIDFLLNISFHSHSMTYSDTSWSKCVVAEHSGRK